MIENLQDEKILVTGGTGFLGGYLIKRFLSENVTPTILTRKPRAEIYGGQSSKPNLVKMNLFDASALENYLEKFRPTIIIHLAGLVHQTGNDPQILRKFNVEATARLLKLANAIGVKRFVLTGTADEYGFQACPQIETMPAMPVSDYAVSKYEAVKLARSFYEKNDLPVVILRPFTIYGAGQPARMFVAQAVEAAVKRIPFAMSEGRQKRDLLFVTDFVNAIIKTLTTVGIEGETFNVGSGESIALEKLARKIFAIAGAEQRLLKIGARSTQASELHDTQADITKITKQLDWKPEVFLDEGLQSIVERARTDLK